MRETLLPTQNSVMTRLLPSQPLSTIVWCLLCLIFQYDDDDEQFYNDFAVMFQHRSKEEAIQNQYEFFIQVAFVFTSSASADPTSTQTGKAIQLCECGMLRSQ